MVCDGLENHTLQDFHFIDIKLIHITSTSLSIHSYHLHSYPSMEEFKKTNTGDDVFITIQDSSPSPQTNPINPSPPPTVVLMGWLGAHHRHLSKYASLFREMGYNTVQVIAPPSVVFAISPRTVAVFLLSILRIVAAEDRLTKGGLVFMWFSNGGARTAPHLAEMMAGQCGDLLQADDELVVKVIKDSIAGVLFDSSPVYIHPHLGGKALNRGLGIRNRFLQMVVSFCFTLMCLIQRIFVVNLPVVFWDSLHRADYRCPEQYVYSTADPLMDAPSLDKLIEDRKACKKEVYVFKVEDCDHVSIFRKYPEKYKEVLRGINEWGVNVYRERVGLEPWCLKSNNSS